MDGLPEFEKFSGWGVDLGRFPGYYCLCLANKADGRNDGRGELLKGTLHRPMASSECERGDAPDPIPANPAASRSVRQASRSRIL